MLKFSLVATKISTNKYYATCCVAGKTNIIGYVKSDYIEKLTAVNPGKARVWFLSSGSVGVISK